MISFLRRHQKAIFWATAIIFGLGMFVGFGGYWFEKRDLQGVVARVGDVKIQYSTLINQVQLYEDQAREHGKELSDAEIDSIKREILNSMMVDELLALKADQLGIAVTDEELARDIRSVPAFRRGDQFDQDAYFTMIRSRFRMTPQEFENERRKTLKANKLKDLFLRASKVGPAELREEYASANKGSLKKFDKEKDGFLYQLEQQRALALLNRCLNLMQAQGQVEVQNLLSKVDNGA
jgi:hypothetical protein